MATTAPSVRRPTPAVAALAGGGVLVVLGTFLPWFGLTASGESESVAGPDMSVGLGVLLFGALLALAGLVGGILGVRSIRKPVAQPAMGASVPPPPPAP